MPTINAQNWNSSVYVTIMGTPPFRRGKERHAPPKKMEEPTAYRDPIAPYAGIIARLVPLVQFKRVEIDQFK